MSKPRTTVADFWAKVDIRGAEECWPWTGCKQHGYGRIKVGGKTFKAHRMALMLELGRPLLADMDALHKPVVCHNRACCNPAHLYEGTHAQNMLDRRLDGTAPVGEKNGAARLSDDATQELLRLKGKLSLRKAAALYGVSFARVWQLWRKS